MIDAVRRAGDEARENILFFGPWPPPFGGIASNIFELAPGIVSRGYRVATLSLAEADTGPVESRPFVINERFSPTRHFRSNLKSVLTFAWRERGKRRGLSLRRYIRAVTIAHKVNAVVASNGSKHVFVYDNDQLHVAPFIHRDALSCPRVYVSIYIGFILRQDRYMLERDFLRYAVRSTDVMLSCSQYCLQSFRDFLDIEHPGRVLYNNVDHLVYAPGNSGEEVRRRFGLADDDIVLMTMARMDQDMGYDFLLANLPAILAIDDRLNVLMVGASGPMRSQIEKAANDHRRVHCAVDISFEDKPFFFAASDIFTAPSRKAYACLGIANIEAMMSGRAVLSSASGGHVETIEHGVSGILVPFNEQGLDSVTYLNELAKFVASRDLRLAFGSAGRRRAVEMFSNEKIVDDHLSVLVDS